MQNPIDEGHEDLTYSMLRCRRAMLGEDVAAAAAEAETETAGGSTAAEGAESAAPATGKDLAAAAAAATVAAAEEDDDFEKAKQEVRRLRLRAAIVNITAVM